MTVVLALVALAGAGYLLAAWLAVGRFARRSLPPALQTWPSVTILKPIYGDEPGLFESLRSFCDQDYADYDVVFCLHDRSDSALPIVEHAIAAVPTCRARIAFGENATIANPKIANLAKPGAETAAEIVIVSDSDIRVGRDYLRSVVASFADSSVGAVTCLYGGSPNATLASHLGAMHVEEEFSPSVLVALGMGELRFCLGATMALRASVLARIGGLAALGSHLADDHALGKLVAGTGSRVELSRYVVTTANPERRLNELWLHELRWARTNRSLAPAGYAFSFVMYALPFAFANALIAPGIASALLLAVVAVVRYALHRRAHSAFGSARRARSLLIPLRDALSLAEWVASYFGRGVRWRGAKLRAIRD